MKLHRVVTRCHVRNILVKFTFLKKVQEYFDSICVPPNTVISSDITPLCKCRIQKKMSEQSVYTQKFLSESPVKKLTIITV
jgi:hypothetical protein